MNPPAPDFENGLIAIVDDQEANTDLLETFLADAGFSSFATFRDSRRFVEAFPTLGADLVLLDLHMPHLDGFGVMESLRPLVPPDDFLPILVLTSDATEEVKRKSLAGGAKDFLTKPLDEVEVLLRIRNLLETRLLHRQLRERNRQLQATVDDLAHEREVSERLLLNVLPRSVANRLRASEMPLADSHAEATVLFADIVGFSSICARTPPEELVGWLNGIFTECDRLVEEHGLEKIKTIGDAYMAAGGLPEPQPDHAERVANLALAMLAETATHRTPDGEPLRIRIGIHTGRVIAGVLGTRRFAYDLWGETVNTASRMESLGVSGKIHASGETRDRLGSGFAFEEREPLEVAGRGPMRTYWLTGRNC